MITAKLEPEYKKQKVQEVRADTDEKEDLMECGWCDRGICITLYRSFREMLWKILVLADSEDKRNSGAILFHGVSGIGKSCLARVLTLLLSQMHGNALLMETDSKVTASKLYKAISAVIHKSEVLILDQLNTYVEDVFIKLEPLIKYRAEKKCFPLLFFSSGALIPHQLWSEHCQFLALPIESEDVRVLSHSLLPVHKKILMQYPKWKVWVSKILGRTTNFKRAKMLLNTLIVTRFTQSATLKIGFDETPNDNLMDSVVTQVVQAVYGEINDTIKEGLGPYVYFKWGKKLVGNRRTVAQFLHEIDQQISKDDLMYLACCVKQSTDEKSFGYRYLLQCLDIAGEDTKIVSSEEVKFVIWDPVLLEQILEDMLNISTDIHIYNDLVDIIYRQQIFKHATVQSAKGQLFELMISSRSMGERLGLVCFSTLGKCEWEPAVKVIETEQSLVVWKELLKITNQDTVNKVLVFGSMTKNFRGYDCICVVGNVDSMDGKVAIREVQLLQITVSIASKQTELAKQKMLSKLMEIKEEVSQFVTTNAEHIKWEYQVQVNPYIVTQEEPGRDQKVLPGISLSKEQVCYICALSPPEK